MKTATWNDTVVARSDETVVVEKPEKPGQSGLFQVMLAFKMLADKSPL